VSQPELRAIAATEFDDRSDVMVRDEAVQDIRLEQRQAIIGARA